MGKLLDVMLGQLFDSLIADGKKVIDKAATTKEAKNRSKNMLDAYGAGVYYKGKLVRKAYHSPTPQATEPHKGWEKHNIPADTGREYLEDFFREYKPKNTIELICVNAVYYANILESGAQAMDKKNPDQAGYSNTDHRYRIISQILYEMENLQRKYKGSTIERRRAIEINKF